MSTSHYIGLGIASLRRSVDNGFRVTDSYLALCRADGYVIGDQEWCTSQNVDVQVINNHGIQDQVVIGTGESKVSFTNHSEGGYTVSLESLPGGFLNGSTN